MSNSLSVEQLRSQLSALGVDNRGHRNELKARLRRQQQRQQYSTNSRGSEAQQHITIQQRTRPIEGASNGNGKGNAASQADSAASWRRMGAIPPQETVVISGKSVAKAEPIDITWKPIMDSYLILDVEATCERGKLGQPRNASFEYPNESELRGCR